MKIALSGNFYVLPDILETQEELENLSHEVIIPEEFESSCYETCKFKKKEKKSFFEKLKECEALLVVNNADKNGKENYISGSSFLEMGFAHALGKKIFLLKGIPELSYREEILSMNPVVLNGDLGRI